MVKVHNQVRALSPWPGTTTYLGEKLLKITQARPMSFLESGKVPGTVLDVGPGGVTVACGEGALLLTGLQIPGKKPSARGGVSAGIPDSPRRPVALMKSDPVRRLGLTILVEVEAGKNPGPATRRSLRSACRAARPGVPGRDGAAAPFSGVSVTAMC